MAKILAFAGSNNSKSINKQTLHYVIDRLSGHDIHHVDLEEFEIPLFGLDYERKNGTPSGVLELRKHFLTTEAFLIATPEHNSSYPAFLKNILDWISRADDGSIFLDKPVFIMSTSPGARAGQSVREHMAATIPFRGASRVDHFGIGNFSQNFDASSQLFTNQELEKELMHKVSHFFA